MSRYHRHTRTRRSTNTRVIDKLTFMAAIAEPLVTVPQVYGIFHTRSASGVSISAWSGYEILTLIWLYYGWVHKERIILVYQGLFAVLQAIVVAGAIMYGGTL